MSKSRAARKLWISTGLHGAAAVMLIAGLVSRGMGAPFAVFFIFLGLLVVCGLLGISFAVAGARQLKRENYGISVRPIPPGQNRHDLP